MLIPFLVASLGLVILLIGGDALIKGAVNLALRAGISPLVVSLTIVAFGTSAPELLIAVQAILDDAPGLALGNVVGSNTANILMVLGIPALLATLETSKCDARKDYMFMFAVSLLFTALCFTGVLLWYHGLILLTALAAYLGYSAMQSGTDDEDLEGADESLSYPWIIGYLIAGLIALPIGSHLLVENAVVIARAFNVSEVVIGLTLIAIGTSLPELATTVMAALRRHADVAIGNVIGSNIFNLLGIMGAATLIGPIAVDPEFLRMDLWIMLAASALLVPFVFLRKDITRIWGIGLTALYALYLVVLLVK